MWVRGSCLAKPPYNRRPPPLFRTTKLTANAKPLVDSMHIRQLQFPLFPVSLRPRAKEQVLLKLFIPASHIMQRSFQPVMTTIVLTAAMLLACVRLR